jgi:hypothetical protein
MITIRNIMRWGLAHEFFAFDQLGDCPKSSYNQQMRPHGMEYPNRCGCFNERWAEIIGYSLAELAPISIETWKRLVHPKDYQRSNKEFEKVFQHKKKFYSV